MKTLEQRISEQIGAMTLEILKLQTVIDEKDREIAALKPPAKPANVSLVQDKPGL